VLDLCDVILGGACAREHWFDWLRGDPDAKGTRRPLRVDGFYETHGLVVEYWEKQHTEAVPHFDKRSTVSDVLRGEQRRLYDARRMTLIPANDLRLVIIKVVDLASRKNGKLLRDQDRDLPVISKLLVDDRHQS